MVAIISWHYGGLRPIGGVVFDSLGRSLLSSAAPAFSYLPAWSLFRSQRMHGNL